ncbi:MULTISPECIES: NADAR family protein [Providencia]|uniref:NADAR family protein n=1 Tax=Providencia TaxID=586 RepID=UPI000F46D5BF|nr:MULTISPECIES: NADAR family protein [Providencia]MCG5378080.1 NADAR family protein [Providencia rettgeri]MCK9999794.1 NADAR family protein [Providencia rettgeri]MCL0003226.1 NADAR family protein [Providencia rettgeri]MDL9982083.1 NADAR family protein [Providencia rettgeri]HEP0307830.1 NADAR family protein [Providencia rettgeri]
MDIKSLCKQYRSGKKFKYIFFWGHQTKQSQITKSCFSQWYPSPFVINNHRFASAEHFMMAEKARLFGDLETLDKIIHAPNPGAAKAFGREVRGFKQDIWDENRFTIVVAANMAKFSQNKEIKQFLLATNERVLVEASPVDKIWGIGLAEDAENIENPLTWKGLNLLGFALMEVRSQLANLTA